MPDASYPADGSYPAYAIAREPAPPYRGEGSHALWHVSEDPDLRVFHPHVSATAVEDEELVWAIDTRHVPMYWFPRACPRGCIWAVSTTTDEDRAHFFGHTAATRVYVIQSDWVAAMQHCRLFAYRMPEDAFEAHGVGGFWVSRRTVEAVERVEVGNLLARHAEAGIELRITPDLWAFWNPVIASTVEFSGVKIRNAAVANGG